MGEGDNLSGGRETMVGGWKDKEAGAVEYEQNIMIHLYGNAR